MRFPGKSLFSTPKPAAAAAPLPEIAEPAVMPDPDDLGLQTSRRRKAAQVRQRSGRLSTINTSPTIGTALG